MPALRIICTAVLIGLYAMHAHAAEDGWKITGTDFAAEEYFGAALANGQLGIRPGKEPFSISAVLLNHVFDFSEGAGVNTVMPGPVPFGLSMKVDGKQGWEVSQWQQTVDMLDAEHITSFIADGKVKVTYIVRALRNMPFCVTMDVEAEALKPVTLEFENTPALPPDWTDVKRTDRSFKADAHPVSLTRYDALTIGKGLLPKGWESLTVKGVGPEKKVITVTGR